MDPGYTEHQPILLKDLEGPGELGTLNDNVRHYFYIKFCHGIEGKFSVTV